MVSTSLRIAVLVGCLSAAGALANSGGVTSRSGKQGSTCNVCHSGGGTPTVELAGPTELAAGATGTFTLTITGGAAVVGGFNVATDRSTANLVAGSGQKKIGAELTHISPQAFSGSPLVFTFQMMAPAEGGGSVTIFGAGNSANDNTTSSGDRAAADQFFVTILDAEVDAGMGETDAGTGETDAGMGNTDAGTGGTDAGMGGEETDAGTGTSGGGGGQTGGGDPVDEEPQGGCAAAGLALTPIALVGWALYLRRRRQE